MNEAEAEAVRVVLDALLARGGDGGSRLRPSDIGIVTLYKAQERLLNSVLCGSGGAAAAAEVATIDSFQGREKEVIVLPCVRANTMGKLGFLADARRMNVALYPRETRLIVLGHLPTFEQKGTIWGDFARSEAVAQRITTGLAPCAQQLESSGHNLMRW